VIDVSLMSAGDTAQNPSTSGTAPLASPFLALGLSDVLLRAVHAAGYSEPTPIQAQAIPPALEGRDVLGCARTGTGKTAAFVLPTLARWLAWRADAAASTKPAPRIIHTLVLAPTRELAAQIGESIATYGKHTGVRHVVIFGGVSQNRQTDELRKGVDIVVATPGRLCDLIDQRLVRLGEIHTLVLDEFDRMLDQGFLPAIKRVLKELPVQRQTLLFSATMPEALESIVKRIVRDPVRVTVSKTSSTPDQIEQAVCFLEQPEKRVMLEHLLRRGGIARAVVFTRTKHGANRVAEYLNRAGIDAEAIHGNKSQNARERALSRFKTGDLHVLVATDLASRGIDIDDISHVINYDIPVDPESYVHRIGRTARAGRSGSAITFCTREDRPTLTRIERLTGQSIAVLQPPPRDERSSTGSAHVPAPRVEQRALAQRPNPPREQAPRGTENILGDSNGQGQRNGGNAGGNASSTRRGGFNSRGGRPPRFR
jgi:ATP-dependent RNA helicase RhlE